MESRVGMRRDKTGMDSSTLRGLQYSTESNKMQSRQEPSQISYLLSGGIAGAFSKTCTAPLARLTILFQVQGMMSNRLGEPSMLREASRIFREEGLAAFWKGNGVTVVHRLPHSSINFFAYEKYKSVLAGGRSEQEGIGLKLLAGGTSGLTATSLAYPLDLIRTRLAAQVKNKYYKGISHAFDTIVREEGFRGLYKGMGTTLLHVGPSNALNFWAYETLKDRWISQRPESRTILVTLMCGGVAGICSSTATFPIDLVRRRMQLEGAAGWPSVSKAGLGKTLRHIIEREGYRGLYRGILPEYCKVVPGVGIMFMSYEFMKNLTS